MGRETQDDIVTAARPGSDAAVAASTERDLAAHAAAGDGAAFARIMRAHNQRLFRLARGILGSDDEAEEALQDAYVRAYAALGRFRGESSLSTWLSRIVINEALMRLRRRPAVPFAAMDDLDLPEEAAMWPSIASQPEQHAARSEIRRLVEQAVDALPPPFRVVFVMRAVEEMSVEETVSALGIPEATVKTRLHRARRLLQEALRDTLALTVADAFPFLGARCDRVVGRVLDRLGLPPPEDGAPEPGRRP